MTIKVYGAKCSHVVTKEPCPLVNVGGCQSDSRCVETVGHLCRVKVDDEPNEPNEEDVVPIGDIFESSTSPQNFMNVHGGMIVYGYNGTTLVSMCFVPGNWITQNGKLVKCP